jgi:hypothetical protein
VAVVGAVVSTAGERPDLLAGRLVDPPRRSVTTIAVDQPSRTLVSEPPFETPDRTDRQAEELGRLADLDLASAHLVNTHARRCSAVVIVIVSLMAGD